MNVPETTSTARAGLSPAQQELLQQRLRGVRPGGRHATDEIPRRPPGSAIPVTCAQHGLWFMDRLCPESALYNIAYAIRVQGPLDVAVLECCLNEIVRRHEALRTSFQTVNDEPVQVVAPSHCMRLVRTDLRDVPKTRLEAEAGRVLNEEACRPFTLAQPPLWRARLLEFGPQEFVLALVFHHLIYDGWSHRLVMQELAALYPAFAAGQPSPLPDPARQFGDYACWKPTWLAGSGARELEYWQRQLAGAPEVLELPTDRPRPQTPTYVGGTHTILLPGALTESLRDFNGREGVTMFMTLLAAFKVLLHRYTGRGDLVVGTPCASRSREELHGIVGFLVNMLVLRTRAASGLTFRELLRAVSGTVTEALDHQTLPFDRLVQALRPARSPAHNPLFQVAFVHLPAAGEELHLSGLTLTSLPLMTHTSKFDLTLLVEEEAGGLRLTFEYPAELFEPATIARMAGHYRELLQGLLADPACPINRLPMLTAGERQQLVAEWSHNRREYPREQTIHGLFEEQTARRPDAVALELGPTRLTYAELNARANRLAHQLRAAGVGPDTRVALCAERSFETIVALLAILKAGGAYVPLAPDYPPDRLAVMLADTQAPVLLAQRHLAARLPAHTARVILLDAVEAVQTEPGPDTNLPGNVSATHLAYVIYTSGSTGRPKGTAIPHRGVVRLVKNSGYANFSESEVFLQFAPISFDASTFEIWGPLLNGGRLVLMPPGASSLAELGRAIATHGVTTLWLTAGLFNVMVDERLEDLKPLRQLLAGGDVLSVPHVKKALAALPGCRLINGYGPTENTTFTCCHSITVADAAGPAIPIGRPIGNTEVYLLDTQRQPVPVGVPGELYTGGDGLAREYLNQPELTREKFVPHPFSAEPGARLYRTGDLCRYRADGTIEFLGRQDQQVKIRGFRIELEEIESALLQHAAVREAVVVAREFTPGDKRLAAYFVPRDGTVAEGQLREHLRTRLPDYMQPATLTPLAALPLNPNGKVDRKALPAPTAAAAADTPRGHPRTPVEEIIAATWAEVLGLERVGVQDNFFTLGGHSLQTIQIIDRLSRAGLGLTLEQMMQHQTVAELAAVANTNRAVAAGAEEWSSLVTLQPRGSRPPLFLVHTAPGDLLGYMKLVHHLGNDQPVYGFQSLGLARPEAAHRTLREMAAHYVSLLREFQPRGPYHLGGWCFGGNVAMEMAWQLIEQGQEVALLALLETWAHRPPQWYLPYYWHELVGRLRRGPRELGGGSWRRLRRWLKPVDAAARQEAEFAFEAAVTGPLANRSVVYPINLAATRRHRSRPKKYPGRVTLFRRVQYGAADDPSADCGFATLARELEIHYVPGDHRGVLKEPHVRDLAHELAACLAGLHSCAKDSGR